MKVVFKYEESNIDIKSISVIGSFNNYNIENGKMNKEDGIWTCSCEIPSGEHFYKFIINGELKLNDPLANMYLPNEKEELWSVIMINDDDERMYNNTQYTVHIDKYNMNSSVSEEENVAIKKSFNKTVDDKVVTRFTFTNVTGLHTATVCWYTPSGELFQVTENNLFSPSKDSSEPITLWFWMELSNNKKICQEGMWKIKLFIDGGYILEDTFNLIHNGMYSAQGKYC